MNITRALNRVQILKQKFTQSFGLPFQELLPETTIIEAIAAEKIEYRRRLFDPFVTLWAFLSQVLDADKSCHHAVSRVIAWLAAENVPQASADTKYNDINKQRTVCWWICHWVWIVVVDGSLFI